MSILLRMYQAKTDSIVSGYFLNHANWIGIVAKDDIGVFVHAFVPKDAPSMEIKTDWLGFGQKVAASGTVLLDNVVVDMNTLFYSSRLPHN